MAQAFSCWRNKATKKHSECVVDCVWNVMAHAQKPEFVFRRNRRVNLNGRGRQFGRLLAAEVCASAVVMLTTPCYEVEWRVLATHSIRQFPLHFPTPASPCAIRFQLDSTYCYSKATIVRWTHLIVPLHVHCLACYGLKLSGLHRMAILSLSNFSNIILTKCKQFLHQR
jgi:hypothetical protein